MPTIPDPPRETDPVIATLEEIADGQRKLADGQVRLERLFHDFAVAFLDSKFPFGDGRCGDRFSRRRRRGLR